MALYKPPFTLQHGYIFDANQQMVADHAGENALLRIRGWGRIGYLPDPETLQDTVGQVIADALTAYWTRTPLFYVRDAEGDQDLLVRCATNADALSAWRDHFVLGCDVEPTYIGPVPDNDGPLDWAEIFNNPLTLHFKKLPD